MKEQLRSLYREFREEAAKADVFVDEYSLSQFWYWALTGKLDF